MESISNEQLSNVKHVLFGNQKQANVINESVASIVANYIVSKNSLNSLSSESTVSDAIHKLLGTCVAFSPQLNGRDKMFVMLTSGEQSLANIMTAGSNQDTVATIMTMDSESSPKVNFRVSLDRKPGAITREATSRPLFDKDMSGDSVDDKTVDFDERKQSMSPQEAADWLQANILKVAPSAFDGEFVDDKSKALYYANAYFKLAGL